MWDEKSAVRERLFLLTIIGDGDPSDWLYNSHSDRWTNGRAGVKVTLEASESLTALKRERGWSEGVALAYAHCGLAAGVQAPPLVHAFSQGRMATALCGSSNDDDGDAPAVEDVREVTCLACLAKLGEG